MKYKNQGLEGGYAQACVEAVFIFFKAVTVLAVLAVAALVAAQSSVAPVSTRLLTALTIEYAAKNLKPYRPYFPEPYLIQLEEEE